MDPYDQQVLRQRKADERLSWRRQHEPLLFGLMREQSLREKTFATFQEERQPAAYEAAKVFVEDPTGTLLFYGSYGVGKTHLMAACVNALFEQGISSTYVTAPVFFDLLEECRLTGENPYPLIRQMQTTGVLFLDEPDKRPATDRLQAVYFSIIDHRARCHLPMVFSTNKKEKLGEFLGEAVVSRLQENLLSVALTGEDYRKRERA